MSIEAKRPQTESAPRQEKLDPHSINIILPALPGGGKSTVGKVLAEILDMNFVDTDLEVRKTKEKETGIPCTVEDIIKEDGMNEGDKPGKKAFRVREKDEIKRFSDLRGIVIAPGGGAVETPENLEEFRRLHNIVIYLKTDVEVSAKRAVEKPNSDRPLFEMDEDDKTKKTKEELYQETVETFQGRHDRRWFLFEGWSDVELDNNRNDPEGIIAANIIAKALADGTLLEILKDKQRRFKTK